MSFLRRRLSLLFLMLGVLGVFSSFEAWQRERGRLVMVVLPDQPKKARFPDWERPLLPLWTAPLLGVLGLVGFHVLAIRPRKR